MEINFVHLKISLYFLPWGKLMWQFLTITGEYMQASMILCDGTKIKLYFLSTNKTDP